MAISSAIPVSVRDRFKSLDLQSAFELVVSARKGIKPKLFYEFADSIHMPEKKLALLINISSLYHVLKARAYM